MTPLPDMTLVVASGLALLLALVITTRQKRGRMSARWLIIPIITPWVTALIEVWRAHPIDLDQTLPQLWFTTSTRQYAEHLIALAWIGVITLVIAALSVTPLIKQTIAQCHLGRLGRSLDGAWVLLITLVLVGSGIWIYDHPSTSLIAQCVALSILGGLALGYAQDDSISDEVSGVIRLSWVVAALGVSLGFFLCVQAEALEALSPRADDLGRDLMITILTRCERSFLAVGVLGLLMLLIWLVPRRSSLKLRTLMSQGLTLIILMSATYSLLGDGSLIHEHRRAFTSLWERLVPLSRGDLKLPISVSQQERDPYSAMLITSSATFVNGQSVGGHDASEALSLRLWSLVSREAEIMKADRDLSYQDPFEERQMRYRDLPHTLLVAADHGASYQSVFQSMSTAQSQGYQAFLLMTQSEAGERRTIPVELTGHPFKRPVYARSRSEEYKEGDSLSHVSPSLRVSLSREGYQISHKMSEKTERIPCEASRCEEERDWPHDQLVDVVSDMKLSFGAYRRGVEVVAAPDVPWGAIIKSIDASRARPTLHNRAHRADQKHLDRYEHVMLDMSAQVSPLRLDQRAE